MSTKSPVSARMHPDQQKCTLKIERTIQRRQLGRQYSHSSTFSQVSTHKKSDLFPMASAIGFIEAAGILS